MRRVFLADTDKDSIHELTFLLEENHNLRPSVWRNRKSFHSFIKAPEDGAVFIRIDDFSIPGLALTMLAFENFPRVRIVWMAKSESYALEAFPRGVDSYLMLPPTAETLQLTMKSLDIAQARIRKSNHG